MYSHTGFSHKLKGMQRVSDAFFFFNSSVFSGSLSRTLQLTRLPQSPVVFGSGKHCVLSRRQAGSQDDHGTQLFCFPSLGCTACCLMSSKCFP